MAVVIATAVGAALGFAVASLIGGGDREWDEVEPKWRL